MSAAHDPVKGSVLVADDDASTRVLIASVLRATGLNVTVAVDGTSALEQIETHPYKFDAAILDNMMPGLSGFEIIERVSQTMQASRPRLILASALDSGGEIERGLKLGADDYITKPVSITDLRRRVLRQCEMQQTKRQMEHYRAHMEKEVKRASAVQASLMPRKQSSLGPCRLAHLYRPAEELAGDILNATRVGAHEISFYLADVCGHGVAASMVALWAFRFLMPTPGQTSAVHRDLQGTVAKPVEVCEWLDVDLTEGGIDSYLTLAYCLFDEQTQQLHYSLAGHPPPIVLRRSGEVVLLDAGRGPPIGMASSMGLEFEAGSFAIEPGDRVFLYSDGISELERDGEMIETQGLAHALSAHAEHPIAEQIRQTVVALAGSDPGPDDITVFGVEFDL